MNEKGMISMNAALVGVSGYGGMVLFQLLNNHPGVDQVNLYGHAQTENQNLGDVVSLFELGHFNQQQIFPYNEIQIMQDNDVVFFATSAGVTAQLAQPFIDADFPVIDLSGDYRLNTQALYEQWYHKQPAQQSALDTAHYGLVEFESAHNAKYVANPGCYATATLLALAPLVKNDLIDVDSIIVDAKSGTSGAGKKPSELLHFSQTNENLQVYKVNQHQHIPEVVQELQTWNPAVKAIQFNTTLLPITRGLMSTVYAKVKAGVTQAEVSEAFEQAYQDQTFVNWTDRRFPTIKEVVGTNDCKIGAIYNPDTHTVMVVSVIDNLIKGAGGQAIQNFNQMFNFDEAAGLPVNVWMP